MGKMKHRKMAVKSLRHVMALVEAEMAADGCRRGPPARRLQAPLLSASSAAANAAAFRQLGGCKRCCFPPAQQLQTPLLSASSASLSGAGAQHL
jgi:hypothetical protein